MKRMDVRQAWREKLALNMVIWFICACAVFVIAILGVLICPTEHVFSTSELASHSVQNSPNNVYTSIRGEVFDLTNVAATHQRIIPVVSTKSILAYGGGPADPIFPVQVCFYLLCRSFFIYASCFRLAHCAMVFQELSVLGSSLTSATLATLTRSTHDFRAFTNDSRPDWYFESYDGDALEQSCWLHRLYAKGAEEHGETVKVAPSVSTTGWSTTSPTTYNSRQAFMHLQDNRPPPDTDTQFMDPLCWTSSSSTRVVTLRRSLTILILIPTSSRCRKSASEIFSYWQGRQS